jgi:hypothetical protein
VELGTTGTDYAQKAKPLSSSSDHMPIPDYVDADTAAKVKQLRMLTKMLDSTITVWTNDAARILYTCTRDATCTVTDACSELAGCHGFG